MNKAYRFFYHYFRHGEKKMSVHFRGKCYNTTHVHCNVPCETKYNRTQPKLIMRGFASKITVKKNQITIN